MKPDRLEQSGVKSTADIDVIAEEFVRASGAEPQTPIGELTALPIPLAGQESVTPPPAPTPFNILPDQCFAPSDAHALLP
ncbi:hypothetical protein EMCRGX_G022706 [Ephydatia muelleri]